MPAFVQQNLFAPQCQSRAESLNRAVFPEEASNLNTLVRIPPMADSDCIPIATAFQAMADTLRGCPE